MTKNRGSDVIRNLDMDRLYEEIGFHPDLHIRGNDIGQCLFPENHAHGDTTGKFAIHRDRKVYNCWVCGGGSLTSLICQLYGYDPDTAIQWLKQFRVDDDGRSGQFMRHLDRLRNVDTDHHDLDPLPYFNPSVLNRFNGPVDYFISRGISDKVIRECRLCFSEADVRHAPYKMTYSDDRIKSELDYVGPCAIFPHFWAGRLVGWQNRWTDYPNTPRWLPKYTNTSSFPKAYTLFNFDWCINHGGRVIVCESVPTVLFLRSHDIPAVAYFGSVPKPIQLKLMRRFTDGVILSPDNDNNGKRLLDIATEYLHDYIDVWHLPMVSGTHADLGDYAQMDDGVGQLKEFLDRARPYYDKS